MTRTSMPALGGGDAASRPGEPLAHAMNAGVCRPLPFRADSAPTRRTVLLAGVGAALVPPARATPEAMQSAIAAFAGGRVPQDGRVTLVIDALVENGNAVPVTVKVDSPMTAADHVRRIGLFTPQNPQPEVAVFHVGPRAGRAEVAARMRMATSQPVIALALMSDGSVWRHSVDVVVTLAACLEGG